MRFFVSLPDLSIAKPRELTPSYDDTQRLHREFSFSDSDISSIKAGLLTASDPVAPPLSGHQTAGLLQQALRVLDAEYAGAMQILSGTEQDVVLSMQTLVEQGPDVAIAQAKPSTPAHRLVRQTQAYLEDSGHGGATMHERALAVMDFFGKLINNRFESNLGRCTANVVNIGGRTGVIVALSTVLRQVLGFELEKALQLGEVAIENRELMGIAAMLLGSGLNLAGAVRDEINGTATACSRLARVTMAVLSIGTLLVVSQIGTPSVLGASMSSFGMQTVSYTLMRDLLQLFFPLHDNVSINLGGTLIGGATYSILQLLMGEAIDLWAPSSGAGRVMAAAAAAVMSDNMAQWFAVQFDGTQEVPPESSLHQYMVAKVSSAISALGPDLQQDVLRGGINGLVEASDDLVRGAASRAMQVHQLKQATRMQALCQGEDPVAAVAALPREVTEGLRVRLGARIPSASQVADQFLAVNAMRTSAFQVIVGLSMSAATVLRCTSLSAANQAHVVNAVVATAAVLIYPSFVYVGAQSPRPADSRVSASMVASRQLRRRYINRSAQQP